MMNNLVLLETYRDSFTKGTYMVMKTRFIEEDVVILIRVSL
jgi:hypothetical protein